MLATRSIMDRAAALGLSFLAFLPLVPALTVQYCSSLNTASSGPTYWMYQSNGWCHDHCVDQYAFAIVQGYNCWCSDYAPGSTVSSDKCNTKCPGYTELCGGNGVYGYIALSKAPAGTKGASDDGSNSTPVTLNPDGTTPTPSDTKIAPITTVETVTGQVRTVTITPTSAPASSDNHGLTPGAGSPGSGLSTGQAVGLTIGLIALAAVVGAVIYFMIRRRRQTAAMYNDDPVRTDSSSGPLPKRTMSENSRFMLGTDGRQVVEGWEREPEMVAGSRRSRLIPVDPRLDPFAPVYQRGDGSKSRESVATIRDDHDYSRRVAQGRPILRAVNPDPTLDD